MTVSDRLAHEDRLRARTARINHHYCLVYRAVCLLVLALTFFPYYATDPDRGDRIGTIPARAEQHGSLWQELLRPEPGIDLIALGLVLVTVLLLSFAALGVLSTGSLIGILLGGVLIGGMLLQAPGHTEAPRLTAFGYADVTVCFGLGALALVHSLHLFAIGLAFYRRE